MASITECHSYITLYLRLADNINLEKEMIKKHFYQIYSYSWITYYLKAKFVKNVSQMFIQNNGTHF